jgi:hypothetical protein
MAKNPKGEIVNITTNLKRAHLKRKDINEI